MVIFGALLLREGGKNRNWGLLCLVLLYLAGFIRPSSRVGDIAVLAIQNEEGSFEDKFQQTIDAYDGQVAIIWPELSLGLDLNEVADNKRRLLDFSAKTDSVMVVGGYVESGEEKNYNAVITLDGDAEVGMHFKNRPVPLFNDGKKGKEAKAIQTSVGKIGTPICFDGDHEGVIRRMVADGAELILAPSLDAKSWSARQHDQHAELFRHRAAENGRWVIVAASSGRTQIIDLYGNRVTSIPLMNPGELSGMVSLEYGRTFYNRYGWLIGRLCRGVTAMPSILVIYWGLKGRFRRRV